MPRLVLAQEYSVDVCHWFSIIRIFLSLGYGILVSTTKSVQYWRRLEAHERGSHGTSINAESRVLLEKIIYQPGSVSTGPRAWLLCRPHAIRYVLSFYELNHHGAVLQARLLDGIVQHVRHILLHEDQFKLHALFSLKRASFQPLE